MPEIDQTPSSGSSILFQTGTTRYCENDKKISSASPSFLPFKSKGRKFSLHETHPTACRQKTLRKKNTRYKRGVHNRNWHCTYPFFIFCLEESPLSCFSLPVDISLKQAQVAVHVCSRMKFTSRSQ